MRFLLVCAPLLLLLSCAPVPKRNFNRNLGKMIAENSWKQQFTGIFVYDPHTQDTLYDLNSDKYFTPASNTKIFTLFTAMELLPELLPQLQYQSSGDTAYIRGTGDPTLLHPYFKASKSLDLISWADHIVWVNQRLESAPMGPGWSWDDFDAYYAAERSELPLYGNVVQAGKTSDSATWVRPEVFQTTWTEQPPAYGREQYKNEFYLYARDPGDTLEIPFITDSTSIRILLEDYFNRSISIAKEAPGAEWETIYGIPADSVYYRMMQQSDNFLAEQLLIQAAGMAGDTLGAEKAIHFALNGPLADLAHKPRWVDGSGLSRYNLFTPQSMVHVLSKLYHCYGAERILPLFPAGGVSGTLKYYFPGTGEPYVFAKTGTLSNNYCLSGYLKTRSGKILVFSFMNNHYMGSSGAVRERMQPLLEWMRDHY